MSNVTCAIDPLQGIGLTRFDTKNRLLCVPWHDLTRFDTFAKRWICFLFFLIFFHHTSHGTAVITHFSCLLCIRASKTVCRHTSRWFPWGTTCHWYFLSLHKFWNCFDHYTSGTHALIPRKFKVWVLVGQPFKTRIWRVRVWIVSHHEALVGLNHMLSSVGVDVLQQRLAHLNRAVLNLVAGLNQKYPI